MAGKVGELLQRGGGTIFGVAEEAEFAHTASLKRLNTGYFQCGPRGPFPVASRKLSHVFLSRVKSNSPARRRNA